MNHEFYFYYFYRKPELIKIHETLQCFKAFELVKDNYNCFGGWFIIDGSMEIKIMEIWEAVDEKCLILCGGFKVKPTFVFLQILACLSYDF